MTVSSYLVSVIVDELSLPNDKKTFRPIDVGGRAGGVKYKAFDIFVKLALDTGLYGGDEYSMKSAKHEFKSAHVLYDTLLSVHNPSITVPLTCVIDYMGYRATAMASLPISHQTLIYGSDDGGESVEKVFPIFFFEKIVHFLIIKT